MLIFGSSPVFGPTNSDDWTIPSRIQYHLANDLDYNIVVHNFGVVGYSSC